MSCPRRIRALGGNAEDLLRVAAHLYSLQGRPELALAIYLRLQQPDVFAYIADHGLAGALEAEHVAPLMRIDDAQATRLLVERAAHVPPHLVVPALQVGPGFETLNSER